jgi:serine/threonine protein phosphatase PrpC
MPSQPMSELPLLAIALGVSFLIVYLWSARRAAKLSASRLTAVPAASAAAATPSDPGPASAPAAAPAAAAKAAGVSLTPSSPELPKIEYDEDASVEPTLVGAQELPQTGRLSYSPPTQRIVYDDDAADDEPTHSGALILVTATAQTDKGNRRKRNEDSLLAREDHGIFVVADGMGGYRGGEIASQLAVTTIERAFSTKRFDGPEHDTIPPRASELARAIQMANEAIFEKASTDKLLEGMGTTICAARFSPNKQRLYIGHVGDSRVYRMRGGKLRQMTSDHTMEELGVSGAGAAHLSRAVGIWPVVPIDIVLGKPQPGDVYLLCSDGLSKMVTDADIETMLRTSEAPSVAVEALIKAANDHGGKDNVTVIVVRVDDPAKSDRPRAAA